MADETEPPLEGENGTVAEEPDPEQYPKTLCHVDSTPGHLMTKTVATPEEEEALGGDWVPISELDFETAPAAGEPPQAIPELPEGTITGLAASEIPGGTPVVAMDNVPNKPLVATVVRGVLNQRTDAQPVAPAAPEPPPEEGA